MRAANKAGKRESRRGDGSRRESSRDSLSGIKQASCFRPSYPFSLKYKEEGNRMRRLHRSIHSHGVSKCSTDGTVVVNDNRTQVLAIKPTA